MRTIAAFTATRAEYGLLRPVLERLREDDGVQLKLIVTGTHLSHEHGYTLAEIKHDGFEPFCMIKMNLSNDSPDHLCGELGQMCGSLAMSLAQITPDLIVLLGDRYECMGAALSAAMMRIPMAHIHGGEITRGAMDDCFRHAITKLSHLHFTSCESYRQRVIQLGEQPDRVWNVGALGVENALTSKLLDALATYEALSIPYGSPYILCTFHPATLDIGRETEQLRALCTALDNFSAHYVIFTGANADPGGGNINQLLHHFAVSHPNRVKIFPSLGVRRYLSAAKYAKCVAGNSSSGIIEIPSLGVPVVNIGDRQLGRTSSDMVLHCPSDAGSIMAALSKALTPRWYNHVKAIPNPYEQKNTSATIANTLLTYPLTNILKKEFYNITRL